MTSRARGSLLAAAAAVCRGLQPTLVRPGDLPTLALFGVDMAGVPVAQAGA
jgi:hypothetical protein